MKVSSGAGEPPAATCAACASAVARVSDGEAGVLPLPPLPFFAEPLRPIFRGAVKGYKIASALGAEEKGATQRL